MISLKKKKLFNEYLFVTSRLPNPTHEREGRYKVMLGNYTKKRSNKFRGPFF